MKIIVVGNETELSRRVLTSLRPFFQDVEVTFMPNPELVMADIKNLEPDIAILDGSYPGVVILELAEKIRGISSYIGILFIISGHLTPTSFVKGFELGVDDFCLEEKMEFELPFRVRSVYRIKNMTDMLRSTNSKLKTVNQHLAQITITDDLTGLHNMRYFKKRLGQEFARTKRYRKYLSLLMFDIDDFKKVNDGCDHLMGSFVLTEIGKIIAQSVRSDDIPARFGGDEFVIMLPETASEGALSVAKRILDLVSRATFTFEGYMVKVTLSMGISVMRPSAEPVANPMDLLRRADHLLYQAKRSGKNRVIVEKEEEDPA